VHLDGSLLRTYVTMHGPQNVKSSPCHDYGKQSCFIEKVDEAYSYYKNVCALSVDF